MKKQWFREEFIGLEPHKDALSFLNKHSLKPKDFQIFEGSQVSGNATYNYPAVFIYYFANRKLKK